jgi:hypothetical protein
LRRARLTRRKALVPIDALVAEVLDRLRAEGIEPLPPCSPEDLLAFERRHGVELPHDLRAWYAATDGMEYGPDEHGLWFLPLAELAPAAPDWGSAEALDGYFVLVDYMIRSHVYAIRLRGGPDEVVRLAEDAPEPVAASFAEFLEAYLERPDSLF